MTAPGTIIKRLRKEQKMTQEELGNILGVKKSAIQKYEKGEIVNLKVATIRKLCEVFNVSPHTFIFPEGEELDSLYDLQSIKNELEVIEQVQTIYGSDTVRIIESYISLSPKNKQKVLEYMPTLTKLDELESKVQDGFKMSSR